MHFELRKIPFPVILVKFIRFLYLAFQLHLFDSAKSDTQKGIDWLVEYILNLKFVAKKKSFPNKRPYTKFNLLWIRETFPIVILLFASHQKAKQCRNSSNWISTQIQWYWFLLLLKKKIFFSFRKTNWWKYYYWTIYFHSFDAICC